MASKEKWSDKAMSDRETIFESNLKVSGSRYARAEDVKIKNAVGRIKNNNRIGRDDLDPRGFLYVLPKKYKILYRISGDYVMVERVFY